jgi:hypothetical protein
MDRLDQLLTKLPPSSREAVMDFARYLLQKEERREDLAWSMQSLEAAFGDVDDEVVYSDADLREQWM